LRFAREDWLARPPLAGRWAVPSLHDILWWALAAIVALLGALLFWTIVTPVSPLGNWRPAGVRVMSPAARSALFASFDPFNRGAVQAPAAAGPGNVTALALTLFGIRVNAATGGGSAIIAGADGIQQVYRVGTEVMPGVTLAAVHFDHVELSHNGSKELLYIDQSKPATSGAATLAQSPAGPVVQTAPPPPPAPQPGPQPLTVDSVRQGISFTPRNEGGRVTGLQVSPGGDGGAFRAAGFQPGDVITAVGGRSVSGPADAAALAGQLRPGQSVAVTVRRNGQQLPLAITLGP
jgi:general secretion pathway protein C